MKQRSTNLFHLCYLINYSRFLIINLLRIDFLSSPLHSAEAPSLHCLLLPVAAFSLSQLSLSLLVAFFRRQQLSFLSLSLMYSSVGSSSLSLSRSCLSLPAEALSFFISSVFFRSKRHSLTLFAPFLPLNFNRCQLILSINLDLNLFSIESAITR